jgi:hypothetical protein
MKASAFLAAAALPVSAAFLIAPAHAPARGAACSKLQHQMASNVDQRNGADDPMSIVLAMLHDNPLGQQFFQTTDQQLLFADRCS